MDKIIYEPIRDDYRDFFTKADLYSLYKKLQSLYENEKVPEKIIQLNED